MALATLLSFSEVENRVCDLAAKLRGYSRSKISSATRLIEDLHMDSLELVEFFMSIEDAFDVSFPENDLGGLCKAIFARQPFCLSDLAEAVYVQQGTGKPERSWWGRAKEEMPAGRSLPFSQLSGVWRDDPSLCRGLYELLGSEGSTLQYRRLSDGMRCVAIPGAMVEIGSTAPDAQPDERPLHTVELSSFMMDAEPVSTTAYCRFLNSIAGATPEMLADWFVLDPEDDRGEHLLFQKSRDGWVPRLTTEQWPMILVSWYGANAYSLWANAKDWTNYRDEGGEDVGSFLPSEAQWEYAARGAKSRPFPWVEGPPTPELLRFGRHRRGNTYQANTLPLADVNKPLGVSPFGLLHMAGNVWQWCRDWYAEDFYQRPESKLANPFNRTPTLVRSERGGSWIGPAELCRSSFRRGRPPLARGRCLGFRCCSSTGGLAFNGATPRANL